MIETARLRLFLILLVLAGHVILFPLYAQQPVNQDAGVFPGSDEFIESPEQYRGDSVVTGGIVQQTSPIVIEIETTQGTHTVTVTGITSTPSVGDKIRIYGTLTAPQTINSINAFVVPQAGLWYTWGISFFAGMWTLLRLIRHWRLNLSQLSFSRRDTPLTFRQAFATMTVKRGDDNA